MQHITASPTTVTITQWQTVKSSCASLGSVGLSVTAMPTFILMRMDYNTENKQTPVVKKAGTYSILDNPEMLKRLYEEFAEEDLELAYLGLASYNAALIAEDCIG